MALFQDPKEADSIMRVQQDLDDTKIVLVSSPLSLFSLNKSRRYMFSCSNQCNEIS